MVVWFGRDGDEEEVRGGDGWFGSVVKSTHEGVAEDCPVVRVPMGTIGREIGSENVGSTHIHALNFEVDKAKERLCSHSPPLEQSDLLRSTFLVAQSVLGLDRDAARTLIQEQHTDIAMSTSINVTQQARTNGRTLCNGQ